MAAKNNSGAGSLSSRQEEKSLEALSSPLDLQSRVLKPQVKFDFVPFFDCCVIALLFVLIHSELVFAPGLAIDLPTSQSEHVEGMRVSSVLTLRRDMVLFDGSRYTLGNLEAGFRRYLGSLENQPLTSGADAVLLVKMDRQVGMQSFLTVCEIARSAGFSKVQIAALPDPNAEDGSVFEPRSPARP